MLVLIFRAISLAFNLKSIIPVGSRTFLYPRSQEDIITFLKARYLWFEAIFSIIPSKVHKKTQILNQSLCPKVWGTKFKCVKHLKSLFGSWLWPKIQLLMKSCHRAVQEYQNHWCAKFQGCTPKVSSSLRDHFMDKAPVKNSNPLSWTQLSYSHVSEGISGIVLITWTEE